MLTLVLWVAAATGNGTVTYVTAKEAYLDVGRDDGVTEGAKLKAFRRKRSVGTCDVVEVAAEGARCKADRLEPGDRVSFTVVPMAATERNELDEGLEKAKKIVLPSEDELESKRKIVVAAPLEKLVFKHTAGNLDAWSPRASATLRQEVWGITTTPGGVFGRTTIDGNVRSRIGFYPEAFAAGAMRVQGDLIAPDGAGGIDLYVWGASVGLDDGPVVGEVGRFRPRKAPGAVLLDGVQAGARFLAGTTEVGAYAGAIPDIVSTGPSLDRLTAGAYFGLDFQATRGIVLLPRARLAVVAAQEVLRAEFEAQAQLFWAGIGNVGLSAKLGAGGSDDLAPTIEGVRADIDLIITEELKLTGGYRFLGVPVFDYDVGSTRFPQGPAHHSSLTASYQLDSNVRLGVVGGVGRDVVLDTYRGFVGPEVGLAKGLGGYGGLELGYLEELGEYAGRSAYVSALFAPLSGIFLVTRVSYFEADALGDSFRELGLMGIADAPIFPFLTVRGRAYAQQALPSLDGAARSVPTLLMLDLGVTGSL